MGNFIQAIVSMTKTLSMVSHKNYNLNANEGFDEGGMPAAGPIPGQM